MDEQNHEDVAQKVLVLAPFGRDAALLTRVLNRAKITAEISPDTTALCCAIPRGLGAALIANEALTKEGMRQLTECVQSQEPWSDLPIFVMTQQGEPGGGYRLKHLEALGNVTILERPLRGETLVSAFRMGLRSRAHQYQLRSRLESERAATRALGESERRYRTLAESMPQLVWTCNPDGQCDYLSRQWLEYTGLPERDQLGFAWLDLIHPDDRRATEAAWRSACATGSHYDVEYRLRGKDGKFRWFKTRGMPQKDSDGAVQKWFGSCTDIEDQKQISEERRELLGREQRAREMAELLNRVGPMLLAEMDPERLAQKVTDLAARLTGAQFGALFLNHRREESQEYVLFASAGAPQSAFEDFRPRPDSPVFVATFKDRQTVLSHDITLDQRFSECLPPLDAGQGISQFKAPLRSYLAAPLVSRSGEVMGALLFGSSQPRAFEDLHVKLTEGIAAQAAIALDNARLFAGAQRSQETLRQSNLDLRRANEDLNQFAFSASHDLQEPLRMVSLYGQMVQRKYCKLLDDAGVEYLNYMVQGARRMEMLLRDLLDYTQVVSSHDETENVGSVDPNSVLGVVLRNLSNTIEECEGQVEAKDLPLLAVKEVHLLQLLQNVIANALKYRSHQPPRIFVSAQPDGGLWKLSVADNGIGIASQYANQVFGLFKRLHGSSQYEGTGIGLAICQKIVESYGGRIWVQSEGEGKGSTFCFTLPGVPEGTP